MNPRLVAIAGINEGKVYPLEAVAIHMGRDQSNPICLNDPLVSRRHCVIERKGTDYVLRDLQSSNGTLVNDVPVRERVLVEGDRLKIGDSRLLFLLHDPEPSQPSTLFPFAEEHITTRTTIILQNEDAFYLQPEKLAARPPSTQLARDLQLLLRVSTELNQNKRVAELQRCLLDLIFAAIPADSGVLLLDRERWPSAERYVWRARDPHLTQPPAISRTVLDQVRHEGLGLLSNDLAEDVNLSGAPSLIAERVHSLLVVPLRLFEQTCGAIYLDTRESGAHFEESHLQLLTAIANIAALALENAQQLETLTREKGLLQTELNQAYGMIGESAALQAVYQFIQKVAPADSTVLIRGESGTGKELAARGLHQASPRKERPFIAVNCAVLAESLLASQLFGHKRGAFTGAVSDQSGVFETANGGTLFLDEIGDTPLTVQAGLLRALQERVITRLGETKTRPVNVRIIAATNRPLENLMQDGYFRNDLYYRLNVLTLTMPALRDRRDDIPLLSRYFVEKCGEKCKRPVKGLSPRAVALLRGYDWPGNVRELENAIERAVVLGSTALIEPEDLPNELFETAPLTDLPPGNYHQATREARKQLIIQTLEQTEGNFTTAAKLLGIHPNNLHRLVRQLGLREQFKK